MALMTEDQKDAVRDELYKAWGTCYNCMPYDEGPVWIVPKKELAHALQEAIINSGVINDLNFDPADFLDELVEELQLSCPNCGTEWETPWMDIGEHFGEPDETVVIKVPTINDNQTDFLNLFKFWQIVNQDCCDVAFDFLQCHFLRQNAVAFLGGLARLVESRGRQAQFKWDTLQPDLLKNLKKNTFYRIFGRGGFVLQGNTVPYREDAVQHKDELIKYLKNDWLGRGWVHVSKRLSDAIAGQIWEIYANAFEHAGSPIGIFSCGQYYPVQHLLKLTVVDFGVGIPSNVRLFLKNDPRASRLSAENCLRWAFKRGTTTKPNGISRGVGLDLLKDFIKINKGKLEIFSHEGYALIEDDYENFMNLQTFFEGTLVNITLRCDESYYHFVSETGEEALF